MAQPGAPQDIAEAVRRAFRAEPRLGPGFALERIALEGEGVLALEGTVARLSRKKLALLRAAAIPGVIEIVDRMRVAAAPATDRNIRVELRELFARDPSFGDLEIREDVAEGVLKTDFRPVSGVPAAMGRIDIEVNEGVVTLNGTVPTLVRKRLAGAMAWWVPGVRDVVNGIAVEPQEEDGPDRIEEAVRTVLERNRAVDASQVKVGVRHRVVRLTGLVHSDAAREIAENDAWAVFGVDDVIDEIEVRA